jgi:alkaline phosphatase
MLRPRFACAAVVLAALACHDSVAKDPKLLQQEAIRQKAADWGYWGADPAKYSGWTTHSNRLIPVYTFGADLADYRDANSIYRDEKKLTERYGYLPEATVNPTADYLDQTDVAFLQRKAGADGKKCIVLVVFDGMDWQTTWAAAIAKNQKVAYREGRGTGLNIQDYNKAKTDFGFFVTSPYSDGARVNVNTQKVENPGSFRGGYNAAAGGSAPWQPGDDIQYLLGKGTKIKHAYPDSAATATSLTAGIKTYNDSINVDPFSRKVAPVSHDLQKQGYAIGVVTSVPISHATPACAYSQNVHRDDYQDLTRDLLGLPSVSNPDPLPGVDVLLGAGWGEKSERGGAQGMNFVPGNTYLTDADAAKVDIKNGGKYVVAQRTSGKPGSDVLAEAARTAAEKKQRLFGFFGGPGGHLPFRTADGKFDPVGGANKADRYTSADIAENPNLSQLAVAALDTLAAKSDKIWLMVEAGDVDWANHNNNIDDSIGAVISGDEAFLAVANWIEKKVGWDNAVVIVTADHGHFLHLTKPETLAQQP